MNPPQRLVILSVILGLLMALVSPVHADNSLFEGSLPHWAGSPKGYVRVVDKTGGAQPVRESMAMWNKSSVIKLTLVQECPKDRPCMTIGLSYRMEESAGLAYIYYANPHIYKVDIELNAKMRLGHSGRLAVLCHEIGHGLGLDHAQSHAKTCMTTPPQRHGPDAHDFAELKKNRVH